MYAFGFSTPIEATVPIVSLQRATTRTQFNPSLSRCACRKSTMLTPSSPLFANPFARYKTFPDSIDVCSRGKEKLNPAGRILFERSFIDDALALTKVLIKAATLSKIKSPVGSLLSMGIES